MASLDIDTTSGFTFAITGTKEITEERANALCILLQDLPRRHTVDQPDPQRVVRFHDLDAPEVVIALDKITGFTVNL